MTHTFFRSLSTIALAALFGASAHASDFSGRGVYAFKSASGCPVAALSGPAAECNRIALDDAATRATLDATGHTIRFSNTQAYPHKTVVGDVLLQGSGTADNGKRVPLTFHLLLSRAGSSWSVSSHVHAPVAGKFAALQIEPYQVVVNDDGKERVVLTPAQITAALSEPSLAARVANELVQVRDNTAGTPSKDADITIALGLAKAAKSVARARFHADPAAGSTLDATLQQGSWSLELKALTGQIPRQVVQRDLFLFGLEAQGPLKALLERGFKKNETLELGAVNGKGYLRFAGQTQDFAGADAAARAFMQHSFIGLVLAWQHQQTHAETR